MMLTGVPPVHVPCVAANQLSVAAGVPATLEFAQVYVVAPWVAVVMANAAQMATKARGDAAVFMELF